MRHAHVAWGLRCAIFDNTASGLLAMHVLVNTHTRKHTDTHTCTQHMHESTCAINDITLL